MSNGHVTILCILYLHIDEAGPNQRLPRRLARRQILAQLGDNLRGDAAAHAVHDSDDRAGDRGGIL